MREILLAEARTRLEQFAGRRDPVLVAGPEVLSLIGDLLVETPDAATDLEVAYVAGALHWYRHLVLGSAGGQQELSEALRLLEPVNRMEPAVLPDSVRQYLEAEDGTSVDLEMIAGRIADLTREAVATRDRPRLDQGIEWMRQVLRSAPARHPRRARWLSNLGAALHTRFQWSKMPADLDEAVSLGRESLKAVPDGHPERARCMANLGAFLGDRFSLTRRPVDLDEVIALTRESLRSASGDPTDRARWLSNLGGALQERYRLTGLPADLDAAVTAGRESVAAASTSSPDLASFISNLAAALQARFERGGALADLDEAVTACRHIVAAAPHDHRIPVQTKLSSLLLARFEASGVLADLDEAISAARDAVRNSHADDRDRAAPLSNIGNLLQTRFERTGVWADLDEAVAAFRRAISCNSASDIERSRALSGLGNVLRIRFEHTEVPTDLDEAITACREALATGPNDPLRRPEWLSNLGVALRARFDRSGAIADLDEAVAAGRAAVEAASPKYPGRAICLANLGAALRTRFGRTGAMADLDAAIETLREAGTTANLRIRASIRSNLGLALLDRVERTGAHADLEEAVTAFRDVLADTPAGHLDRAKRLAMLGIALRDRSELMETPADLEEAITVGRNALAIVPVGSPDRPGILTSLSLALRSRNRRVGSRADLDETITAEREALVNIPADRPVRAQLLSNLCVSLRIRFAQAGDLEDINEAIAVGRQAAAIKTASPYTRALAARSWGMASAACKQWRDAAAGLEEAVVLLGQVAPHSLERHDQEFFLENMAGLASDAAACCVHAGLVDRAIELFEQGRGVLMGQALDARTDLTAFAMLYPDLAEQFAALRDELAREGDLDRSAGASLAAGRTFLSDSATAERRKEAAAAFDRIISEIRMKPGMANFLHPLPVSDLTAAAADGPIVVINVSRFGSHALVLTATGVRALPLDDLTPGRVEHMVMEFQAAFKTWSDTGGRRMAAVFGWLWNTVCSPVLSDLGIDGRPAEGCWPRVWWCVSGKLSLLPVHAAGHHHTRSNPVPRTVMDRAISSYIPTIRSLIHARRPRVPSDPSSHRQVMVVAMPDTPGAPRLAGAAAEAELIGRRFGGHVQALVGPEATYQAVITALPAARWAHFACHSSADLRDPSANCLLLADHKQRPLTVADIFRLRLEHADLAFLSACSTARAGHRLTDEAVNLTSAFQLAGYRHVIGTLWPIDDVSGTEVTGAVYQEIAGDWTAGKAAEALHGITLELRNRLIAKPWLWASHIHSGA